jgi:hypothetical protein
MFDFVSVNLLVILNFNPTKYFVIYDLQTMLRQKFIVTFIVCQLIEYSSMYDVKVKHYGGLCLLCLSYAWCM